MKYALLLVAMVTIFYSCSTTQKVEEPGEVAEKFLTEYIHMNYESAMHYATDDFKSIIENYDAEKTLLAQDVIKEALQATISIKNIDIQEAEGVAYAKFSNSQLPDVIDQLELRKIGNKWLANNIDRTVDVELDNQFPEDEIEKMLEEAEEDELPLEISE